MKFSRRIAIYLARNVLLATLAAWAILLTFDAILAMVGELRDVGKESYTLGDAVLFTIPLEMVQLVTRSESAHPPKNTGVSSRNSELVCRACVLEENCTI